MNAPLEVEGLSFGYGDRDVLRGLTFRLEPGERAAILGRSGAGKTTLLRLIAGLTAPQQGRVLLEGREASSANAVKIAPEARGVGLVFQGLALWEHMTVAQTLDFAAGSGAEARQQARALADRVGLGPRLGARPDQLSGGERQRLALIRALASRPRLLLLDEPFAHLDAPLRQELTADLLELAASLEITLLLVTHQASDVLELTQRVLVLDQSQLVADQAVEEALARPTRRLTCELLGLGNVLGGELKEGALQTALGPLKTEGQPPSEGPVLAYLPPTQLTVRAAEGEGVGRASGPALGFPGGVQITLDQGTRLRGLAPEPLLAGSRIEVAVKGQVRLLEG